MNEQEAVNRVFEDGDQYRMTDDEDALLEEIRSDLIKYYNF